MQTGYWPSLMAGVLMPVVAFGAAGGDKAVKAVADHALTVSYDGGKSLLPLYLSTNGDSGRALDLSRPQPAVVRVVIVIHGLHRNALGSNEAGMRAVKNAGVAGAGTLLMAPQFLEEVDVVAFHLPGNVLRWAPEEWMAGAKASNAPVSSFAAMDSIFAHLGDRKLFPNLKTVVLAGHSAGGQFVQRYAVVGKGGDGLAKSDVLVRYVVANPSSYLYFSPERPVLSSKEAFAFAVPEKTCSGKYERWKYGLADAPSYVNAEDTTGLEARYVKRDVRYLLGTKDNDPDHPELDKSCSGETEGPYRLYRGKSYFKYLETRHPELAGANAPQQLWLVPGVEHDVDRMLNSQCGLAALFGMGSCGTRVVDPKP